MRTVRRILLAAAAATTAGLLAVPAATAAPSGSVDTGPRLGTWGSATAVYRQPGCTDRSCLLALDITIAMVDSGAHCSVYQRGSTGSDIDTYTGDLDNGTYTRYAVAWDSPWVDASVYCTDRWGHSYPSTVHLDLPLRGNLSGDVGYNPAHN